MDTGRITIEAHSIGKMIHNPLARSNTRSLYVHSRHVRETRMTIGR